MAYRPEHFDLAEIREDVRERLNDEYDGPSDVVRFLREHPDSSFVEEMEEADRTINDMAEQEHDKIVAAMTAEVADALMCRDADMLSDPPETM